MWGVLFSNFGILFQMRVWQGAGQDEATLDTDKLNAGQERLDTTVSTPWSRRARHLRGHVALACFV